MRQTIILVAIGLALASHPAMARTKRLALCHEATQRMREDPLLGRTMKAAYPDAVARPELGETGSGPCIYPSQAMAYEKSVVLLTLGQAPGEACHGCSASLNAVFFRRDANRLRIAGRQNGIAHLGTFGSIALITPVRIGAEDGIVAMSGGTFQGESSGSLDLFIFRGARAKSIGPRGGIFLDSSNCEAKDEGEPCHTTTSTWRLDPGGRLLLKYVGKREDGTEFNGTVIYEWKRGRLALTSGADIAAQVAE